VAREFGGLSVPVVAVLGNHDYQSDQQDQVAAVLVDAGIIVLEGTGVVLDSPGGRFGVAGVKGFGGGFAGRCASEFGEPEMKEFVRTTRRSAKALEAALMDLDCPLRIALTHYSPVPDTLAGEPPEIYPFLGSYLLAQVIDAVPTALAVHGHAHHGSEIGQTAGGVPVRNVAHPVIREAFRVYDLDVKTVPI
jgi:Icc-related predicted phosphoesterase